MRALLLLALVGCGPNLQTLASQRHYREAVCAADDGSRDDRVFVQRALAADADPHIHVAIVEGDHLARALDGASTGERDRIANRIQFVRVQLQTHVVPVDGISASIDLVEPGGPSLTRAITWDQLAAVTEERLPPQESYTSYLHGGTFWRGALAVFTGGMSLPFTRFRARTYVTDAPLPVYQRTAPLAYALREATHSPGCRPLPARTDGRGITCTWYLALDRERDGDREAVLSISLAYRAERKSGLCEVSDDRTIKLGRVKDLAPRASKTFGSRMRPLRDFTLD